MVEAQLTPPKHKRHALLQVVHARPRLLICAALGVLGWFVFPEVWRPATRILLAWNISVVLYLVLAAQMLMNSSHKTIQEHANRQDEGRYGVLFLTCLAGIASIAAIVAQLAATKDMVGASKSLHIALAALTILSAFAFIHLEFALLYAHEFVTEAQSKSTVGKEVRGGIEFPGTPEPDYWDFLYFSYVIGVACATADANICSQRIRRVSLMHCILAFFFNTTVLALTINIAAGLF